MPRLRKNRRVEPRGNAAALIALTAGFARRVPGRTADCSEIPAERVCAAANTSVLLEHRRAERGRRADEPDGTEPELRLGRGARRSSQDPTRGFIGFSSSTRPG